MAKKRKTLPKNFEELLENTNIQELIEVFDKCEIEAKGGYSKNTALGFVNCPYELAKWLVEHGADIEAVNDYGYTPLQEHASHWKGNVKSLLDLGADVNLINRNGTPLHCAVRNHRTENVKILLQYGAKINVLTDFGYGKKGKDCTELEVTLMACNNKDIEDTLEIAKILLNTGAKKTKRMKEFVTDIGKSFEEYRPAYSGESAEKIDKKLAELYQIFEVEPVPSKEVYDGKSPITVKASKWQKQHEELWQLLVPVKGKAQTIQGEVIRITGKVSRELMDNGGANWDVEYKKMVDGYFGFIQKGNSLSKKELEELSCIIKEVKAKDYTNVYVMAELGVKWVLQNTVPLSLTETNYDR